ncbi:MAG: hypothetical protein QOH05_3661 [Acetobacteraceae bacterium]|nr:hypothetical protein [Acetobacteraceae bacterium]
MPAPGAPTDRRTAHHGTDGLHAVTARAVTLCAVIPRPLPPRRLPLVPLASWHLRAKTVAQ